MILNSYDIIVSISTIVKGIFLDAVLFSQAEPDVHEGTDPGRKRLN